MQIERIDWPDAIREKVERRHGLAIEEVESSLFDRRAHVRKAGRDRYALLGRSDSGAYITVIFAYRRQVARIITARKMDSKERRLYRRRRK